MTLLGRRNIAFRQTIQMWLLLAFAAALASLPLLTRGYSCGHDFDFHLRSWMEASTQWQSGILRPVWAFHAAWNAGEPRLLFYPPLSWITGALLTLIVPWSGIVFAYTALVLLLCGITMHRLLARWTSPGVALLGGCLYMVNPYMLFCAYERTAYAELMAAAWFPLLIAALLRERISTWRIAVAVALLWLTNAPAGVMGCYTVLLLAGMRLGILLWKRDSAAWPFAGRVTLGVVLGFLLDSAYLLPFAMERRYITLTAALTPAASPDANYLYEFTKDEFHNGVLLHSSNIASVLIGLALLCGIVLLLHHRRVQRFHSMHARDRAARVVLSEAKACPEPVEGNSNNLLYQQTNPTIPAAEPATRTIIAILTAFSAVLLLLQLPISSLVWHHAPEMKFMQFPWRLLAVQGAVTITLLALLVQRYLRTTAKAAYVVAALLLVLAMSYGLANRTFRQGCDDEEGLQPQWTSFHAGQGFEQTDEYTPASDDNDQLQIHQPRSAIAGTADSRITVPGRPIPEQDPHIDDWVLTPSVTRPGQFLILRLRAFHGWHILRDGTDVTTLPHRADGLFAIPLLTAGTHRIEVRYRTPWDFWAGYALSLMTFLGMTVFAGRRRPPVE